MNDFENKVRGAADFVTEKLDGAVDGASQWFEGERGNKVLGGAAVGALVAIVLPVSLLGGALLGAGYAAYRNRTR
ncbi:hypothetical protein [Sphingomonas sp.]|uniref:hypothetical protein n=1 Tax=Sphingomonas sp. TaxID=28214 RepID=UPI002BB4C64C|nr:hypothetical protein [Sphingomonas sp.]HWK35518.1 hypothetical protein [Sphingomonas sp.]